MKQIRAKWSGASKKIKTENTETKKLAFFISLFFAIVIGYIFKVGCFY